MADNQRFVLVATNDRVVRMDTFTSETWTLRTYQIGADAWRVVDEPSPAQTADTSDVWDFIEEQIDQWTPDRETKRSGFDGIERAEVREFLRAARAQYGAQS